MNITKKIKELFGDRGKLGNEPLLSAQVSIMLLLLLLLLAFLQFLN